MKRKEMSKRIIALIYAILLCVTVSFAWILSEKENIVKDVTIGYNNGKLVIAPTDIQGKVLISDSLGNETELTDDFEFNPTDIIPNSIIAFSLRLRNNSYMEIPVNITFVGITAENPSILDVVYFSATPSTGWKENTPPSTYINLGDAVYNEVDGTYTLTVLTTVVLRPTEVLNEDDYMGYECYFYFDGEAMTNAHQDANLEIGTIRISQK